MPPTVPSLQRPRSRPQSPAAASTSNFTSTQVLPPIAALPALSFSPTNNSMRTSHSHSHSHSPSHSFVHSHSPSHSVPPLGGARPRSCRLLGCANFAKIQGFCAAHYHGDDATAATSTSTPTSTPTARLPSLRMDQHQHHHALERPRLPYYTNTNTNTTNANANTINNQHHNSSLHQSPLYSSDHQSYLPYQHQHHQQHVQHQHLPSLSVRRFSEPPAPLRLSPASSATAAATHTPLHTLPVPLASFPRVSPLHRLRQTTDDAFAQFRRAQPTRHALDIGHGTNLKPSPTHSTGSASGGDAAVAPGTAAATPTATATAKAKCRREHCTNAARRKGLCMEHGGRHFCKMDGCQKCAHRGGYCIAHGGGRRCAMTQCSKSAQSGGVCYSHGGGKRCATDGCSHAARSGGFCIKHGKLAKTQSTAASDADGDESD